MARAQYRAERRACGMRATARWVAKLVSIALGGMFMLQNMGMVVVHNTYRPC
ncbi:MAG: hypothetical protein U0559_18635 [Anaerolineae bacterium]